MAASAAAAAVSDESPAQEVYAALPKAIQLETQTDSLVDRYNRVRGIQSGNPKIRLVGAAQDTNEFEKIMEGLNEVYVLKIETMKTLEKLVERLLHEIVELLAQITAANTKFNRMSSERLEYLRAEMEILFGAEVRALQDERDAVVAERDAVVAERDDLKVERDALEAQVQGTQLALQNQQNDVVDMLF
eukprot:COSAG02_NODE_10458_length_1937_cov_2.060936_2_plen_189_part_00